MPRPDPFTPRRRLLMKVIVWLVFFATLGLAQLVVYKQSRSRQVELASQPLEVEGISVRLPNKWKVQSRGQDSGVIAEATEGRASSRGARTITVYTDTVPAPMSSFEYLERRFQIVSPIDEEEPDLGTVSFTRPTRFGSYAGVMGFKAASVPGNGGEPAYRETCAAAVLPSGRVVAIKLLSRGERDLKDTTLVDQVARAITINNEPELAPPDTSITLAGGIQVKAPSALRAVASRDPHRTSRTLWYVTPESESSAESRWASIELVPCLFPSAEILGKEQTDAASELRTMLVLRDPHWRDAKIKSVTEGYLEADMTAAAPGEMFASRAFLQPSPSGQALLAIVRAPAADLNAYWNQMRPTIQFNGTSELPELIRAGRAEVTRLRELPLEQLLAQREDDWFLWVNQTDSPQLGWSHIEWRQGQIAAETETRRRIGGGRSVRAGETWTASSDWNRFRCDLARIETSREETARRIIGRIDVKGDSISLTATANDKSLEQWKRLAPEHYVPGALLVQLIGKISPTPMIVRTDSFLGYEGVAPDGLFMIIIRAPAQPSTTKSGVTFTTEVNGSGEILSWRFGENGLEKIDLPDGITRIESKEDDVKRQFARDPEMLP